MLEKAYRDAYKRSEYEGIYAGKIGGTVLFNYADMSSEQLAGELEKAGICVRAGLHCAPLAHKTLGTPEYGAVRVSFSIFNTKNEVDNFYRVYSNIVK